MAAPELRLWGEPLTAAEHAVALREVLAVASRLGWSCALSLAAARGDAAPSPRARPLTLTDGARERTVFTALAEAELAAVVAAATQPVAATAPLLVFGDADDCRRAGLEFPAAEAVLPALGIAVDALLAQASAAHRRPAEVSDRARLLPFVALPIARDPAAPVLHPGSADPARGTDLAVRAAAALGVHLAVQLPRSDARLEAWLRGLLAREDPGGRTRLTMVYGPWGAERVRQAAAIVLPVREALDPDLLATSLASGRPVAVSRFAATAAVVEGPGHCLPIGGRWVRGRFEPSRSGIVDALRRSLDAGAAAVAARARRHALERPARPRPVASQVGPRPVLVLEAPMFELSSSAHLTLQTARALLRRGRVDLHLVPSAPLHRDVSWLRSVAPELEPCLTRRPPPADLWLASGWPPRADRPVGARQFGLRVDWEYGALPTELTPAVTQEADWVVVHSAAVHRLVRAAGRPAARILTVPHGVDGVVFGDTGPASRRVLDFARGRPAMLFVGGLIWRKGIDLVLRQVLQPPDARANACLVVKPLGGQHSYAGHELGALLQRVRDQRPDDVLILDDELDAAALAAVYRACDLLVHPYRGEGFGLPVLEARACGVPTVTTAGGSTADFCEGGGCLAVPAERRLVSIAEPCVSRPFVLEPDPAGLAEALRDALRRLPDLRQAARAAAPGVRAQYSWAAAAKALERLAFEARYTSRNEVECGAHSAPSASSCASPGGSLSRSTSLAVASRSTR
ncbi:MAG: glycosyltransferase [Planctomycetota bacterium]